MREGVNRAVQPRFLPVLVKPPNLERSAGGPTAATVSAGGGICAKQLQIPLNPSSVRLLHCQEDYFPLTLTLSPIGGEGKSGTDLVRYGY